jgi:hypothetical protein
VRFGNRTSNERLVVQVQLSATVPWFSNPTHLCLQFLPYREPIVVDKFRRVFYFVASRSYCLLLDVPQHGWKQIFYFKPNTMQVTMSIKAFPMANWNSRNNENIETNCATSAPRLNEKPPRRPYVPRAFVLSSSSFFFRISWLNNYVQIWFWNVNSHVKLDVNYYYVRLSVLRYHYRISTFITESRFSLSPTQCWHWKNKIRNPRNKSNQLRSNL